MTSVIRWGLDTAYEFRETIFTGGVSFVLPSIIQTSRGRDGTTLAKLSLEGRLKDVSFKAWIDDIYGKDLVAGVEKNPDGYLASVHFFSDLSIKCVLPVVAYATTFFAEKNVPLSTAINHLLSQIHKTAQVSLPVFNLPLLLCAPIAAKSLHLFFVYLNDPRLELLTTLTGKVSKWMEVASWITFALYNLGCSKTLMKTAAVALCTLSVEKVLPGFLNVEQQKNILPSIQNLLALIPFFLSFDALRTNLFLTSLNQFITCSQATTAPYDTEKLCELYKHVTEDTDLTELPNAIHQSVQEGKIHQGFADRLLQLCQVKEVEKIKARFNEKSAEEILGGIEARKEKISEPLYLQLKETLKEKLKNDFSQKKKSYFIAASHKFLDQQIASLTEQDEATKAKQTHLQELKEKGENLSFEDLDENLRLPVILEMETKFAQFITKNIDDFSKKYSSSGTYGKLELQKDDFFIRWQVDYHLFESQFNQYFEKEQVSEEQEIILSKLAGQALIEPNKFVETTAFSSQLDENSRALFERNPQAPICLAYASAFIPVMPLFYHRKLNLKPIPENFKFATSELPFHLSLLRKQVKAPFNTWPLTHHLPPKYNLDPHLEIPDDFTV